MRRQAHACAAANTARMDVPAAGALDTLAQRAGVELPALTAARERTTRLLAQRSAALQDLPHDDDAAVVLVGSWGRGEVTKASDDDWFVAVDSEPRRTVMPELDATARALGGPAPGPEGIFGTVAFAPDLYRNIGLAADSNANLTRRMLLVLESVAVTGAAPHAAIRNAIVASYLGGPRARDYRPPRFFLNDVVRYWRTVAVDFEGKDRAREGAGWGLRHVKLRTSRKILFASGLLPILECHRMAAEKMPRFLAAELAAPATDRVAAAFLRYDAVEAGARALAAYDRFVALLDDPTARARLSSLTEADAARSPELADARALADQVQAGLLSLLFDDLRLAAVTREYGIF